MFNRIYAMVDVYWASRSEYTVCCVCQASGCWWTFTSLNYGLHHASSTPPLQPAEAGGMYEVITLTPSSQSLPKLYCTFLSCFCQEIDLLKIFGCNTSLRNSGLGREILQETGRETCSINLGRLSCNENLIALRWKHSDIYILCFMIFCYRIF